MGEASRRERFLRSLQASRKPLTVEEGAALVKDHLDRILGYERVDRLEMDSFLNAHGLRMEDFIVITQYMYSEGITLRCGGCPVATFNPKKDNSESFSSYLKTPKRTRLKDPRACGLFKSGLDLSQYYSYFTPKHEDLASLKARGVKMFCPREE